MSGVLFFESQPSSKLVLHENNFSIRNSFSDLFIP
jgi:hypothetical protein